MANNLYWRLLVKLHYFPLATGWTCNFWRWYQKTQPANLSPGVFFRNRAPKPSWLEVYYLYIPPGNRDHHDHHYMFICSFTNVLPRFLSFGDPQNTVTLCFTTASGHRNLDLDCQQYNKEVAPISLLLLYNKTSQKHALPVSIWISCPNIQPTTNMQNVHQVTRSWDLCAQCTSHVNSEVPVGPGWGASKEWYLVADSSPSS